MMKKKMRVVNRLSFQLMGVFMLVLLARNAVANDLDLSITSPVSENNFPVLILHVQKAANEIRVKVKSHGVRVNRSLKSVTAGKRLEIELAQNKVGIWQWKGSLSVEFADGSTGRMPLSFGTEVRRPPKLVLHRNGLNLKERELTVALNRTAQKVTLEVVSEEGLVIAGSEERFERIPAGEPLQMRWQTDSTVPVMKISLVGYDVDGFFSPTLALYPWSLSIPHEEVMFETASAEVRTAETSKLHSALLEMNKRIQQYEKLIPIKLFVLGHTDSVGEKSKNRKLSHERATSIARWFVKQGLKVPVYVRGFGESDLRVPTPDEVDEPVNRRADYILAVEPPVKKNWKSWTPIPSR